MDNPIVSFISETDHLHDGTQDCVAKGDGETIEVLVHGATDTSLSGKDWGRWGYVREEEEPRHGWVQGVNQGIQLILNAKASCK